jgi:hypothetical protein
MSESNSNGCNSPEDNYQEALDIFRNIVATNKAKLEIQKYRQYLEYVLTDQILPTKIEGNKLNILITSDPMEEFDDIVMIRFVLYNMLSNITVILSGGLHTSQERLTHVNQIFPEFNNVAMNKPLPTKNEGTITFVEDNNRLELEENSFDLFVNCGPCLHINLGKIVTSLKQGAKVVTVGALGDGKAGTGINQKDTSNVNTAPQISKNTWDAAIDLMIAKECIIQNLEVSISRYVLFPNPKKYDQETPYGKLGAQSAFFNTAVKAAEMFICSRPPPNIGGRINWGNSIVDYQMAEKFLNIPNKESIKYKNGLSFITKYCKEYTGLIEKKPSALYGSAEYSNDIPPEISAAIPLMATALMGGVPVMGGVSLMEGVPLIEIQQPEVFKTNIEELEYFTPAYDVIAVIMGLNMMKIPELSSVVATDTDETTLGGKKSKRRKSKRKKSKRKKSKKR